MIWLKVPKIEVGDNVGRTEDQLLGNNRKVS